MNNVIFRPACPQDALEIAQLTIIAGGGIFEFLLEDFVQDMSLETLLALEIKKETGIFSYVNVEVVELKDKIIGMIKSSDAKNHKGVEEMRDFLPKEKLDWLQNVFVNRIQEGLYIHGLSVDSNYRKQGIGTKLINQVKEKARKQQFSNIHLTVWTDNITAIEFYERQGFREVKHIKVDFHPLMPHHGGMKLMQCFL
ncbi:MAG: GNAT family N-acetyltransferase [Crocosphaera sp.]|jgi:ribosomal protein S18 acetylase RimI-like enzyme